MIEVLVFSVLLAGDTVRPGAFGEGAWERGVRVSSVALDDPWFGEDKFKHFAFSYALTATGAATARLLADADDAVIAGAALGVVAGIAKELYDRRSSNTASLRDLLWDLAGVGAGVLLMQQVR